MADKALYGRDPVNGRSAWNIVDHYGPASYVVGGETWPQAPAGGGPNAIGLASLQWVSQGITESGTYRIVPIFGGTAGNPAPVKQSIKLKWYVVSTGLEVSAAVNLSAEVIRLLAIGG